MATHATIRLIDASTVSIEMSPFSEFHKDKIKALFGSEWNKKLWLVPLCRLGDVVKIFIPHVSIDYDVLRARDVQLCQVFRQYMACGVQFDVVGGKVVSDHPLLNEWLVESSSQLHVNALEAARKPQPAPVELPVDNYATVPTRLDTALWNGIQNASKAKARKEKILSECPVKPTSFSSGI